MKRTLCPNTECNKLVRYRDDQAGKRVKCPKCNHAFRLPLTEEVESDDVSPAEWDNNSRNPSADTPERYERPKDHKEAIKRMEETVWGKWHWVVSGALVVIVVALWAGGTFKGVDAIGKVSFFGTIAIFATRYVFASNEVLSNPKLTSLIGTKNVGAARAVLIACALIGWIATVLFIVDSTHNSPFDSKR